MKWGCEEPSSLVPGWIGACVNHLSCYCMRIKEWWGVTDIIKAHAEKISSDGEYRCLVPDLYKGKIGVDKEEASHVCLGLNVKDISHGLR